ncbi:ribbon-helix-helix protein, CopG family [Thiomicrorhabdus sp. ZW0627]|uniref:CopG family ribbon-helix-helix protein n=1 Tax=Thiomicrorhabdus sp. ZW0627 TaxID=3039774 RepID=UPI002436E075|nr:ribbon-helix-helix protein, CopG family [Thiomicrorhabdus sp. ZW0627]MDG6773679.1 ribbon-helix-helix protein, CopG family [Thiomicrorhabdus sp. ZW0627]
MNVNKSSLVRVSASMPAQLLENLDRLVKRRGFNNRSALLMEMIQKEVALQNQKHSDEVMAGTVTLYYDHTVPGLQHRLNGIKHKYVAEIISSTQIQLVDQHTLEVNLLQGSAQQLQLISDEMIANRGVKTGNLYLVNSALPPIQSQEETVPQNMYERKEG